MADANSTLSKVPFWAVHHLGKKIELVRDHVDFMSTYPAGSLATLDGITVSGDAVVAVVTFDVDDDPSYLLHVPFDLLCMPGEGADVPLREVCASIPGRAGEIAYLWTEGVDPRDRVSLRSYYRYKRELAGFGLDISRPFGSQN